MSSQVFSDWMMVLGYVVAPLVFGAFLFYGVLRTRRTKPSEVTDRATKAVYDADERERRQKAQAAEKSSRPIDLLSGRQTQQAELSSACGSASAPSGMLQACADSCIPEADFSAKPLPRGNIG